MDPRSDSLTLMRGSRRKLAEAAYLGTDRSPLALLSGLQRSVTTVLRPAGQDDVASRDLNGKVYRSQDRTFWLLLYLCLFYRS